ncbi:MAG: hypothetical protein J6Y57_00380 [Lachnospiraceae bacterium]|nr:hypothetical protein [Lachnospiraceae bacterium]
MKIKRILICFFCILMMLCTACMPPGYSNTQKKTVAKEHAAEAKQWFSNHLPEAKVQSAKAYADGIDLYSIICGDYKLAGETYEYFYDYYNDSMFLGKEYEEAVECAWQELASLLNVNKEQIRFYPAGYRICAMSEDDRDPAQYVNVSEGLIETNELNVLPAEADPEDYGKKMIYEGLDNGSGSDPVGASAFVYVPEIPSDVQGLPGKLSSLDYLAFIRPTGDDFDGLCEMTCYDDWTAYTYLHTEKAGSKITIGYTWRAEELYDETGNVSDFTEDIAAKEEMNPQPVDGGIDFHIPQGAEPIVLAPKGSYVFPTTDGSGNPYTIKWYEESSISKENYLGDSSLAYFSTFVFPNDGRCIYTMTSGTDRTEFSFTKQ